jgi:hypothetical protein
MQACHNVQVLKYIWSDNQDGYDLAFEEMGRVVVDWIVLSQDRVHCRAFVNKVINLWVTQETGIHS